MTKIEFLADLYEGLSGLPEADLEEQLNYYCEMIDDRMEEGLSEEAAVEQIGTPEDVITQILAEIPMSKLIKRNLRLSTGEIVLICVGSPLWFPLLIAAFAVVLALYVSWWAVIVSLWSVFVSLAVCGIGGVIGGASLAFTGGVLQGFALIGLSLFSAGLSVFAFYGCKAATKGTLVLTKNIWLGCKKRLMRKEKGV